MLLSFTFVSQHIAQQDSSVAELVDAQAARKMLAACVGGSPDVEVCIALVASAGVCG